MSFEADLKRALVRKEPPPDFARRVLEKVSAEHEAAVTPFSRGRFSSRSWRALAAAALVGVVLAGWTSHEVNQRRAEGERARAKVLFALRIAGSKVAHAQREVRELGSRHEER